MAPSSKRKEPEQLTLDAMRYRTGRGGPRYGAGRPRGIRPRHAPAARGHRRACARAYDDPLETRRTDAPSAAVRATVPLLLERSLRPPRLPCRALLDPTRSRASVDRSAKQLFDRLRNEECWRSNRRGASSLALRAAQSRASRREAATDSRSRQSTTRSGQFRPLVRWLAHRHRTSEPHRHLRDCSRPNLAPANELAPSRARPSRRRSLATTHREVATVDSTTH